MKITVTRTLPIAFNAIAASLQRAAVVFVVTVFGAAFLLSGAQVVPPEQIQLIAVLCGTVALGFFWLSKVIDAFLQARGNYIELSAQQVSGASTGFTSNSFTIPLHKIATVHIHQDFIDKLFGVAAIVCTQMNVSVSVYGFSIDDAQAFVKKCAALQSKK